MKENLKKRLEALDKKAKAGNSIRDIKVAGSSSLNTVIKTKERADLFMKLLKEA